MMPVLQRAARRTAHHRLPTFNARSLATRTTESDAAAGGGPAGGGAGTGKDDDPAFSATALTHDKEMRTDALLCVEAAKRGVLHRTSANVLTILDKLTGQGLCNVLGTMALGGCFHDALWHTALSSKKDSPLRTLVFNQQQRTLLYQFDIALQLEAPHLDLRLPSDVLKRCRDDYKNFTRHSSSPMYTRIASALKRKGIGYSRDFAMPCGYLAECVIAPELVLELDGPWNCVSGTDIPSLASQLRRRHYRVQEVPFAVIPKAVWDEHMSGNVDALDHAVYDIVDAYAPAMRTVLRNVLQP